jgi:serine/threonine protein kinase
MEDEIDPDATRPPNTTDHDPRATVTPPSTESYTPEDTDFATIWVPRPEGPEGSPPACLTAVHRYRLIRYIAQGGLGRVLLARDEVFGREVALKHIRPGLGQNPDLMDRFLIEAQITGNLEHPGIVGVYAIGEDAGQPFYVMRLIRGESLKEAIRRFHDDRPTRSDGERTLALRKLLNRMIDVCNAIAFAHSRGVLHRDIKPANIMIGKYGETLVVDWGLAKRLYKFSAAAGDPRALATPDLNNLAEMTASGHVVGTPAYMSPEQAEGRQDLMEPTSDVYSLGATLYHILTGRPPIQRSGMMEVIDAARKGDFQPPRLSNPTVDPALEAICLKAMSHEPENRYATARALADDLERWLADEPIVAYREPPSRAMSRWLARHPMVLIRGLVAAVGLLIITLAGIMVMLSIGVFRAGR